MPHLIADTRPYPLRTLEGVRVGNVLSLAFPTPAARKGYAHRLRAHGYQVQETEHFTVCRHATSSQVMVLHSFEQTTIDADLICNIADELAPLGFIASERFFGGVLFAVLASTFPAPRQQERIWLLFCENTLARLREGIADEQHTSAVASYIGSFAAIYRRVFDLFRGPRVLDVGCSFGFLPVLLAEQHPVWTVIGCDKNPDAIAMSTQLATAHDVSSVAFRCADVLSPTLGELGSFETVTALHLLEHFDEADVPVALDHLLQVTSRRLIIAVPYEYSIQPLYGHRQLVTADRLAAWGQSCVERLRGNGRWWQEEVMGGLLVVERCPD
jgi:SAM-dependent methyltransferase